MAKASIKVVDTATATALYDTSLKGIEKVRSASAANNFARNTATRNAWIAASFLLKDGKPIDDVLKEIHHAKTGKDMKLNGDVYNARAAEARNVKAAAMKDFDKLVATWPELPEKASDMKAENRLSLGQFFECAKAIASGRADNRTGEQVRGDVKDEGTSWVGELERLQKTLERLEKNHKANYRGIANEADALVLKAKAVLRDVPEQEAA